MPRVLTVLLGLPDERPAGYVYRALRNPSARIDVLRDLLEKSPSNKNKSQQYDELISKYQTVRSGRNAYAHGLWWTDSETNAVYLARRDEHGFAFFDAQPEPLDNLKALHMQIGDLIRFLHQTIAEDLRQLQQPQGNPRQ